VKNLIFAILALSSLLLLAACNGDVQENDVPVAGQAAAEAHDHDHAAPAGQPGAVTGTILETMNSGGYSYVHVDTGAEKVWAAGSQREGLTVGQTVSFNGGMVMSNFTAKSLDRTFEKIYFVSAITLEGETAAPAAGGMMGGSAGQTPAPSGNTVAADAGVSGVTPVAGGYTVGDIYAKASELGGKTVKVRGQVVKFTANIMGTNWVHVQDGTGSGESKDLTVTTADQVAPGDMVVVEGPLSVDKDFGAGYKYHVIIENAKVVKE